MVEPRKKIDFNMVKRMVCGGGCGPRVVIVWNILLEYTIIFNGSNKRGLLPIFHV